jgi:hypothetical protein
MRLDKVAASALVSLACLLAAPLARAQLYGDKKDVTKGELNDQDYWWAKFDDMMLDLAVKQKQPEGAIAVSLASSTRRLDELAKKYPAHEDIKKWRQHAVDVQQKLDPNANRGASFGPGCPWNESNFAQIWVNVRWAKASWDEKDYTNVQSLVTNLDQNLKIMLAEGRMKDYPPELSASVRDAKPEAERLAKLVHEKLTHETGPAVKDAAITTGDLNDQDYWWARYDDMMLDVALKARAPEGRIGVDLASAIRRLDELAKKFPKHEGIKQMKEHAEGITAKIDPNADRNRPMPPDVPWEESNFAQLWVNLHHAQFAHAQKDDATAKGLLSNVRQNHLLMLAPDRMKQYPPELRKWVEDSEAEIDALEKELKPARKGR